MPQRIFKRKPNGTSTRNSDSSTEEFKEESLASHSSIENEADSTNCVTKIPNRIFVGGLSTSTDEWDIRAKFSKYGHVKFVKIIRDSMGISKGYGFVTFSTEAAAKNVIEMAQVLIKGRKLNIGPALKKQTTQSESHLTEISSADSLNEEIARNQPRQDHTSKYIAEYPWSTFSTNISYSLETPGCLDATMFQNCPEIPNGNSQVNCILPYPTLVYVSQYPCQYPMGIACSVGANFPDMMPLIAVPATPCCTNGEPQG